MISMVKLAVIVMAVGVSLQQCPVIFRQQMPDEQCVRISDEYPKNKTVYVDSCSPNRV